MNPKGKVLTFSYFIYHYSVNNQNAYIERFNRTYREDVFNPYLFETLEEVRQLIQQWQWQYNNERPHASLNQKTPMAYLLEYGKRRGLKSVEAFSTF